MTGLKFDSVPRNAYLFLYFRVGNYERLYILTVRDKKSS